MPYPQEQHHMASKTLIPPYKIRPQHIIGYEKLSQYKQGAGPFI